MKRALLLILLFKAVFVFGQNQNFEIEGFKYYEGDSLTKVVIDTVENIQELRLIKDFKISKKSIDSIITRIENCDKYYKSIGDSLNSKPIPNDSTILVMNEKNFNLFHISNLDLAYMGDRSFEFNEDSINIYWFAVDELDDWAEDKAHYFIYSVEYGVLQSLIPNFFSTPIYCWKTKRWDRNNKNWISFEELIEQIEKE